GSYSVGAVFYQAGCCGAQPHSIVFLCSFQPAKSFTPVNSCGLRLPLLEPTGYECRGLVGQVAVPKQQPEEQASDITKLLGFQKCACFYMYAILDCSPPC